MFTPQRMSIHPSSTACPLSGRGVERAIFQKMNKWEMREFNTWRSTSRFLCVSDDWHETFNTTAQPKEWNVVVQQVYI